MASKRQNKKSNAARRNAQAQTAAENLPAQEPQPAVPHETASAVQEAVDAPEGSAPAQAAPDTARPQPEQPAPEQGAEKPVQSALEQGAQKPEQSEPQQNTDPLERSAPEENVPEKAASGREAVADGADAPKTQEQVQEAPKKPRRRRTRKKPAPQEAAPAEDLKEPKSEQQSEQEGSLSEAEGPGETKPESEGFEAKKPEEAKPETKRTKKKKSVKEKPKTAESAEKPVPAGEPLDMPAANVGDELALPAVPEGLRMPDALDELVLPPIPSALKPEIELPGLPDGLAKPPSPQKKRKKKKKKKKKRRHHWIFWTFVLLTLMIAGGSGWYIYTMFTESDSTLFDVKDDVELPNLLGLRWESVRTDEAFNGFTLEMVEVYDDEAPIGEIVDQNPRAPRQVKENSRIIVKVSKGVETVTVPDVTGWNRDTAREKLSEMNLTIMFRTENVSDVPSDSVIRTEPEAGTLVKAGTTITVYIRRETSTLNYVTVPTCIGAGSATQAGLRLSQRGLLLRTVTAENAAPEGTVIAQSPSPGAMVTRGTYVTLTISQGPPPPPPTPDPVPVPDPIPAPEPDPNPEPVPAPGDDPNPDTVPTPDPAPEPEPEPVPEPIPEPEPGPEPTPEPTPSVPEQPAADTPETPSDLS